LTACRLRHAIESSADALKKLFVLKDCFEATIKYLGVVLVTDYLRSPACKPERNETLLEKMLRPSLGVWVQAVVGDVSRWLAADGQANLPVVAIFVRREGRSTKPKPTSLLRQSEEFVGYRNDALGHGALRRESVYLQDLERWLPVLQQLLEAVTDLAEWRLCLVTDQDRCQLWMGRELQTTTEPGSFQREQIGHFLMRGPNSTTRDLYPFLCYLPDAEGEQRLHFYDSIYRYQETRKEVSVLEYDNGFKHASTEPVSGLEQAFTTELLKKAFQRHQGRMEVIEGRVANFGELLVEHADIVGRRFVIDHVQRFIEEHDRGLLVIQAEPGKGKTALTCHLVEDVFGHFTPQPVHFFYRRTAGITDPDVCVRSLYHALLQWHEITESEESQRQTSPDEVYEKLTNLLADSIAPRLSPSRPQLIFIDALDESDTTAADRTAFDRIPENLPAGVYVIATTWPVNDRATLARRDHLHWYDLDSPDLLQDNLRDGAEYVHRELLGSDLPNDALEEISRLGNANFLVLKLLVTQVRGRLESNEVREYVRRLATDCGQDQLGFIYREFWTRLTNRLDREDTNLLCDVAGLLVTARAPLTREMICCCLGLRDGDWDFALRHLSEYLAVIEQQEGNVRETYYRIYHESFADFLRSAVVPQRGRYEKLLGEYCLGWSEVAPGRGRLYALRFGPIHLCAAARWEELETLLTDIFFLEAKAASGMNFELIGDFSAAVAAIEGGRPQEGVLRVLEEALRRDIHFISRHAQEYPQAIFQCLWNTCWWYDCEESTEHSEGPAAGWPKDDPTCGSAGAKLRDLLSTWLEQKEQADSGFRWLRSLRPPVIDVGSTQFAVLRAHLGPVTSVAFAPDGSRIVSGSYDNTVRLWHAGTGAELGVFKAHEDVVTSVAFSPDGTQIASGSFDKTVRLWDVASAVELTALRAHEGGVTSVAFSPDGARIACGSDDETVRIWDVATGEELIVLRAGATQVYATATSADGRLVASGADDSVVRVWDAETGAERATFRGHGSPIVSVAFFPDARQIASGSEDLTVHVWDVREDVSLAVFRKEDFFWGSRDDERSCKFSADHRWLAHTTGHGSVYVSLLGDNPKHAVLRGLKRPISSVAFSPDAARIAAASEEGMVRIWNSEGGVMAGLLQGHERWVTSVAFSPDGRRIASGSSDKTVRVWDAETFEELLLREEEFVSCVAYSPDGHRIASGGTDTIRIWDAETKAKQAIFQHEGQVNALAFSPDGRRIVSGSSDETVRVWDVTGNSIQPVSRGREIGVNEIFFSPHGRRMATSPLGVDGLLVPIWDTESGRIQGFLRGHIGRVTSVAFSPDSRRIVTGSWDKTVRVWDAETLQEVLVFFGNEELVTSVAFSPDGRQIASGGKGAVRLWDAESGAELIVLGEPVVDEDDDYVDFVTFSPDGTCLAVGAVDVAVWNLETGTKAAVLHAHEWAFTEVAFAPDGRLIRTWSQDGTERVWDARSGEVLEGDEVAATARITAELPWRAIPRGIETVVEPSTGGAPVAWFPVAFWQIETHPNGRLWGGTHSSNMYIIKLEEGGSQPSSQPPKDYPPPRSRLSLERSFGEAETIPP